MLKVVGQPVMNQVKHIENNEFIQVTLNLLLNTCNQCRCIGLEIYIVLSEIFAGLYFHKFSEWVGIREILFMNFGLAWLPRLITYMHLQKYKREQSTSK